MKILGIDPGLRQMGWAVITQSGQRFVALASGVIKTNAADPLARRLCDLSLGLEKVIETYAPDQAAVEETFVNSDPRSALKLGQARGVALLIPARCGLSVSEYAANQIKKTVVGSGHADKSQVEYMIKLQIQNADPQTADAADAFAIALTHAHLGRSRIGELA